MEGKEIWKDILGYEGKYQVSNWGRVKSLIMWTGACYIERERIIKPVKNKDGYMKTFLSKDGKVKTIAIHRLVAEVFIPNPDGLSEVNHKDEDKTNNHVCNLEWCTNKYNVNYGSRNKKASETMKSKHLKGKANNLNKGYRNGRARKVLCVTTGKRFNCIKEAGEYYLIDSYKNISKCCKGKIKYCGEHPITGEKLIWKYIEGVRR